MSRRLLVHLDGVAALRQTVSSEEPDPVAAATLVELGGAHGVAVQLRGDRRYVQDRDARLLRQTVHSHFELDIAPTPETLKIALELRPDAVTLVNERDGEQSTESGLDLTSEMAAYGEIVRALDEGRIRGALEIDPDLDQVKAAHRIGVSAVRLFTKRWVGSGPGRADERSRVVDAVRLAGKLGMRVAVGGGLDYRNVADLAGIDGIDEFSVGHAVVSRGVLVGLERATAEMVRTIRP